MSTMVEIQNLKKYFKSPRGTVHAVDDVTMKIEKGSTMGIVGESGSGKSTIAKAVMGQDTAHSPFSVSAPLSEVFCLGCIAQRLNRGLKFDPATKSVVGDETANRLLKGSDGTPRKGVDWDALFPVTDADGVEWYVVECETNPKTLDSVRGSIWFLKSKGRC